MRRNHPGARNSLWPAATGRPEDPTQLVHTLQPLGADGRHRAPGQRQAFSHDRTPGHSDRPIGTRQPVDTGHAANAGQPASTRGRHAVMWNPAEAPTRSPIPQVPQAPSSQAPGSPAPVASAAGEPTTPGHGNALGFTSAGGWRPATATHLQAYDVVVLAGGAARRFGGADKVLLPVAGRPMLERVLAAGAGARTTVVVGPRRPLPVAVRWTREDPPGSGPLAALAAGLSLCEAPITTVLAADMPMLDETVVAALVEAASADDVDGAVLTDDTGEQQPLAAAYRRQALQDVLTTIGDPRDRPMRLLLRALRLATVPNPRAALDCDTPDDLFHADRVAEQRLS